MIYECPHCQEKRPTMIAVHGRIKTLSCLSCGQGWKTGINGSKSYNREVIIGFNHVMDHMIVMAGKRKVILAAIPVKS